MTAKRTEPMICIRPSFPLRMTDAEGTMRYAKMVEDMGFDAFFLGDRMLAQAALPDGQVVYAATSVEPTTMMAAIAGRTSRIQIGVLVYIVPFRRPLQIAKTFASLDFISNGRIIMGAGLGWNPKEFASLGLSMADRGSQFEEAIPLIRQLWRGDTVTFHGRWSDLEGVRIAPISPRPAGPPIWMGTFAPTQTLDFSTWTTPVRNVLDRVGRHADAWAPLTYTAASMRRISAAHLGEAWNMIMESAVKAGRASDSVDLVHADWIYILDGPNAEQRGFEAVSKFFTGSWQDAKNTYVIGTPDEVVDKLLTLTSRIKRKTDAYMLTPISSELSQLDLIRDRIAPKLREEIRKS